MRTKLIAVLLLIVPSVAFAPWEARLQTERARLKYGNAKTALKLRDQITQNGAVALLAGLRGIVADFLWIQGHEYWEKREWLRQYRKFDAAVTLQPQSVLFWDLGSWHIAWNIGYAERVGTNEISMAEGIRRERIWHERAREFLERGLGNIPNQYDLYFKMGWLYYEKLSKDCDHPPCAEAFCRAAEYFGKAATFSDAPQFVVRIYSRAVERCGDRKAAYEQWKELWFQDHSKVEQAWHVIEREIRRLEDEMNVPNDQRVFPKP